MSGDPDVWKLPHELRLRSILWILEEVLEEARGTYNWLNDRSYNPLRMPLRRVSRLARFLIGLQVELKPSCKYPGPPSSGGHTADERNPA